MSRPTYNNHLTVLLCSLCAGWQAYPQTGLTKARIMSPGRKVNVGVVSATDLI